MNRLITLLSLSALLIGTHAQADHERLNLKDFRTVCVNAYVEFKATEDKAAGQVLYNAIADQLEDAGIRIAQTPCQEKGLTGNRQINLFYTFTSTPNGTAYFGMLEGWLHQESKYKEVTLWHDYSYGATKNERLQDLAGDLATELTDSFIEEWDENH